MQAKEKIGLFGGTFDPLHIGHLIISQYAKQSFSLDRIFFIPNYEPPHKKSYKVTPGCIRFEMASLIKGEISGVEVSDYEIKKKEKSYTIDTVRYFRDNYKGIGRIYFIMGSDSLKELHLWKDAKDLCGLCEFIIFARRGKEEIDWNEISSRFGDKVCQNMKKNYLTHPVIEISSSEIRRRVREGLSIKFFVPEKIERFIFENNLYLN